MRIILLLMAVIYLYNDWKPKALKNRFKSKAKDMEQFNEAIKNVKKVGTATFVDKGEEFGELIMIVFAVLFALFNSLFSILAACYIPSFVFILISAIMILITCISCGQGIAWIISPEKYKPRSIGFKIIDLIGSATYVLYIVYYIMMSYIN